MTIQDLVLRNRKLTNFVMSRISPDAHAKRGEKYALSVFEAAASRTRSYPSFLSEQGIEATSRMTTQRFAALPPTSKHNYVDRHPLTDLCLDGRIDRAYTIERSSGHSGGSYYWLRLPQEDGLFPRYLEHAFVQFYGMDRRSTLVLITLSLGTWTSGEKMAQALREVAALGKYRLTVMAPGTNLDEILEIVEDLSPLYDQTVVVGYPPFIKTALDEGTSRGVDWPSLGLKIGLGGEGYSEEWREHVASIVGVDSRIDLLGVSGGYGAADIGMSVGREYPATVMIRKLCMNDPDLAHELFQDSRGNHTELPSLLQYNPASCFIEQADHELLFTVLSGIPLVRYNIRDTGGVIRFDTMLETLKRHGYDLRAELGAIGYGPEQLWTLPFFYVHGRSDGTVSIVGANVFPENVQSILAAARDRDVLTFKLKVETTSEFSQRLVISLEHHADSLTEEEETDLSARYYTLLVEGLRRVNADFRQSHDENPEAADPVVRVHARGTGPFESHPAIKNNYLD
jgi:phenylacetate-CoA ligase